MSVLLACPALHGTQSHTDTTQAAAMANASTTGTTVPERERGEGK